MPSVRTAQTLCRKPTTQRQMNKDLGNPAALQYFDGFRLDFKISGYQVILDFESFNWITYIT